MAGRAQDPWASLDPHASLDTQASDWARILKHLAAAIALGLGGLGVLGWMVQSDALKAAFMSNVAMKHGAKARVASVGVSLHGVFVLVVDDEPDACEFVARVLMDSEATVEVASSVAEALELINRKLPSVLISDIGMAERDGYDLIAQVRATLDAKMLPAIAVTAFARAEDRRRALGAGFQLHIAKPVDPHELTLAVASLAGRTGKEGMGVRSGAQPALDAQQS